MDILGNATKEYPTMADSVCLNNIEAISGIVASVVTVASMISNFIPAPENISNPFLKMLSQIVHFVAVDIVTAVKK